MSPAIFRAAAFMLLLSLCLTWSCQAADLTGLLGGPKSLSSAVEQIPAASQRVELHATAVQTCGNVSFACPGGFSANSPTTPCSTSTCSIAECCTAVPTCVSTSFSCPVNYAPLNPLSPCSSLSCTQTDCCSVSNTASASQFLIIVLAVDCTKYTPTTFVAAVSLSTGISTTAIVVVVFQCTSLTVSLTILGSTTALANAGLAQVAQVALSGALGPVVSVTVSATPVPTTTTPATTGTTTYPTTYPILSFFPVPHSSSNPALLGLLALLILPVLCCCFIFLRPRQECCMMACPCPGAMGASVY